MTYDESPKIAELILSSTKILILQADNPDGDSLGSALALEQIIHEMGKEPILYCGIDIPTYLRHMSGWDRVEKFIDIDFDLSIIVDTSSIGLFDSMNKTDLQQKLSKIPCIVIDHHDVEDGIPFATIICNKKAVATGEVIYEIARDLNWKLNNEAKNRIASSIMSDSQGLITDGTTARSIHIIGELVEQGVSLTKLDNERRELMKKSPELIKYKGELLQRIEYFDDNRIALITIPWEEIEKYSNEYNPSMLVIDEMRFTENTQIAIAFKTYNSGRITAKIRCNYGADIASKLAGHFGGGGHKYASGFRIEGESKRDINEIKQECIKIATELLNSK